jgi:hypothetical protein
MQSKSTQTIEQLADGLGRMERASVKAELKRAAEVLLPDEQPSIVAVGRYEGAGNSLLILTDRRFIIVNETGSFTKTLNTRDVVRSRITDVESKISRNGEITIHTAATKIRVHGILPVANATQIANALRQ